MYFRYNDRMILPEVQGKPDADWQYVPRYNQGGMKHAKEYLPSQ